MRILRLNPTYSADEIYRVTMFDGLAAYVIAEFWYSRRFICTFRTNALILP